MKNKAIALLSNPLLYHKKLNSISGGVLSSLLMCQLEYWFAKDKFTDGFFKFQTPAPLQMESGLYRPGDSWCEETGFTIAEFRTAFKKIGLVYDSKGQFQVAQSAGRQFVGPDGHEYFYLSFVDRKSNLTWYMRNHEYTDQALWRLQHTAEDDDLSYLVGRKSARKGSSQVLDFKADAESASLESGTQVVDFKADVESASPGDADSTSLGMQDLNSYECRTSISRNADSQCLGMWNLHLPYTETTSEITSETTTTTGGPRIRSSSRDDNIGTPTTKADPAMASLIYPAVSLEEVEGLKLLIAECPERFRQLVLDETEGQRAKGFRSTAIAFARSLVLAVEQEAFRPNLAIGVARDREKRRKAATAAAASARPVAPAVDVSEATLLKLPPTLRRKHQEAMERSRQRGNA